jgi:hypothetical protein
MSKEAISLISILEYAWRDWGKPLDSQSLDQDLHLAFPEYETRFFNTWPQQSVPQHDAGALTTTPEYLILVALVWLM